MEASRSLGSTAHLLPDEDGAPPPGRNGRGAGAGQSPAIGGSYKWIALSNTTIGVLIATMNSSILLIALPNIFDGIHLDPLRPANTAYLLWLLMGYLLVTAVLVVSLGRVGDIFGRVRMYNLGFAVFTVFSILLSATWLSGPAGAEWLIAMRVLQGVGGAFLMANSSAILTDAFPHDQRGLALGINAVAAIAGSFIGLVLGGLLGPLEWRLVFLVSVPFGVFGTIWAYLKLRDVGERTPAKIDWWGNVTFGFGLVLVLVGITYGIEPYGGHSMGWTSPWVLTELGFGTALLAVFVWIETKVPDPMFRIPLFRIRAFSAGNLAGLLAALGRGGLMFVLIIWLQGIWLPLHGYSFAVTPLWAGIYMLPLTVGFIIAGPVSGYLSDRLGARPFATAGMIAAAISFALLELLPVDFPYLGFAGLLLLNGLGMGLFSSPNRAGIMNSLPANQRGAGAGMVNTFQNAGMVLSIGIYFTLIVIGLTASLPHSLLSGLTAQGVPSSEATRVAHEPPVGILFAALLGYNPVKSLLGPTGVLAHLPAASVTRITGRSFFPSLIAGPFSSGLHRAFEFSIVAMVIAALASWMRGGKYHHVETGGDVNLGEAESAPAPSQISAASPTAHEDLVERLSREVATWRERALSTQPPKLVVAISGAFGAGGSVVGPMVAHRLRLPFVDRAIPAEVAAAVGAPLPEALEHDEKARGALQRLLAAVVASPSVFGTSVAAPDDLSSDDTAFRLATELALWKTAAETGGVVLGRAAVVVLASHRRLIRVRLDGPVELRVKQAVASGLAGEDDARRLQLLTDGAREAYARHLYGVRADDPSLYDMVIDLTRIGYEAGTDVIVLAAQARVAA